MTRRSGAKRKPRSGPQPPVLRVQEVSEAPAARVSLAAALLDKGHLGPAEREVRAALHDNPESAQGHLVLALIEAHQGRLDAAADRLRLAGRLDDADDGAIPAALAQVERRRGRLEAALAAVARAIPRCESPADAADLWVFQAEVELESGRRDAAARSFGRALEADPDAAGAHRGLARLASDRGEWGVAGRHAERAVRLFPTSGPVRQVLGDARFESGRFGDALWQYTRSVFASPAGYRRAAARNLEQGYAEEALGLLRVAAMVHPRDPATSVALARAYDRLGRRPEAIAVCEAALRLDPDHAEAAALADRLRADGAPV